MKDKKNIHTKSNFRKGRNRMMVVKKQVLTLQAYTPGRTVDEVKKMYGLDQIVKLASNENPFGSSSKIRDAIYNQLEDYAIYPDGAARKLKERVAEHLQVPEEQLIFSAGLDELIQMLSRSILDADSNTVMADETFSQYKHHAVIEGAEIREVPLKNGVHDLDAMLDQIDSNTKIVWICNPNNPTGTYVNKLTLEAFLDQVPNHVLVVLDEAYYEYVTAEDYPQTIPYVDKYDNVIVLRTFSKAYGLASFRIGYGVGKSELISHLDIGRLPFNTSSLAHIAAITALDDQEFVENSVKKNAEGRELFYQFFNENNISYFPSEGNFVYFQLPHHTSQEAFEHLMKQGYIIRAFPKALRVTVGSQEQNEGVIRLLKEML